MDLYCDLLDHISPYLRVSLESVYKTTFPGSLQDISDLIDNGGQILGAFDGNTLVGFAKLINIRCEGQSEICISRIGSVRPEKGIGTLVLSTAIAIAADRGAETVHLAAYGEVRSWYVKRGFTPVKHENYGTMHRNTSLLRYKPFTNT